MSLNFITKLLVLLLLPLMFTAVSCNKPTEPTVDTIPGRRDYVWTVDTLNYPYNTIIRIWGSSPTDVWAVSPGGDLDKTIFHYDGVRWTTDGISRPISPSAIWGFASENIYIGGIGNIWNYNGNSWREVTLLRIDGKNIALNNIWGESSNSLYAFGGYSDENGLYNNSVIAQCKNNVWTIVSTEGLHGIVSDLFKNNADQKIYLRNLEWNNGNTFDSIFVYEYSNNIFNRIYSGTWDYDKAASLSLINGEVYFTLGRKISKRNNNKFITILNLENTNADNNIWGRNSNDLFIRMTDGLAHYNGSDVEYLLHFDKPRTSIFGATLFEKEVFFIVYEAQTNLNLIYHGVLK